MCFKYIENGWTYWINYINLMHSNLYSAISLQMNIIECVRYGQYKRFYWNTGEKKSYVLCLNVQPLHVVWNLTLLWSLGERVWFVDTVAIFYCNSCDQLGDLGENCQNPVSADTQLPDEWHSALIPIEGISLWDITIMLLIRNDSFWDFHQAVPHITKC